MIRSLPSRFRSVAICAVLFAGWIVPTAGQQNVLPEPDPELSLILDRVGERVRQYTIDLQHLAWTTVIRSEAHDKEGRPFASDKPRELTFDTTVRLETGSDLVGRVLHLHPEAKLKLVDGKAVKRDYKQLRQDFAFADLGQSLFFLPRVREMFRFSYAGRGYLAGREAFIIDVLQIPHEQAPRTVRRGDLVSVAGVVHLCRAWIDPATFDALQVDCQLGPVELNDRKKQDRRVFERRSTMRYKTAKFEDPEQVFLVPESFETVTLLEGEAPAERRTAHTFMDFRRFIGKVTITPTDH